MLASAKRSHAKPVSKKEPITPEMMSLICKLYASPCASPATIRTAAVYVTAYAGFLWYSELAGIHYCDIKLCKGCHVEINIAMSKTGIYRFGS